jgi:putative inorganic carbon (HCO3(-)) transporter
VGWAADNPTGVEIVPYNAASSTGMPWWLVAAISIAVGIFVVLVGPAIAAICAVAAVLSGLVLRWPTILAAGLISGAMVVTRSSLQVSALGSSGVTITAERAILFPLLALVIMSLIIARHFEIRRLGLPHLGLLWYLAAMALSSGIAAPDRSQSLRLMLVVCVVTVPFFAFPLVLRSHEDRRRAFWIFVGVCVLEALAALAITWIWYSAHIDLGVQHDATTGAYEAYGTMLEANLLGSLTSAAFLAVLGYVSFNWRNVRHRLILSIVLIVLAAELVVNLSRGAWLGTAVGMLVLFLLAGWAQRFRIALIAGAAVGTAAAIAAAANFAAVSAAVERLASLPSVLGGSLDATTLGRYYQALYAIDDIQQHPWFGLGAGSLAQLYLFPGQDLSSWIGNLELHAIHDSGFVGFVGLFVAIGATCNGLRVGLRRQSTTRDVRAMGIGLLAASVSLAVAFQSTEGTWLSYSWAIWGLAWAFARGIADDGPTPSRAEPRSAARRLESHPDAPLGRS